MVGTDVSARAAAFSAFQLPTVVGRLVGQVASGKISVVQGAAQRVIWFGGGHIRLVSSALESERMGNWLVARGLIDRRAVESALAGRRTGERIGDALVRLSLISAADLAAELQMKSIAVAGRMLGEAGTLQWDETAKLPENSATLDHEPVALFVLSARRGSDPGRLDALLGGDRRWVAVPGAAARAGQAELSGLERFVLARLDLPRTLGDLRVDAPDQHNELARALAALAAAGLIIASGPVGGATSGSSHDGSRPGDGSYDRSGAPLSPASPSLRERLAALEPRANAASAGPTREQLEAAAENRRAAFELLRGNLDPRGAYRLLASVVEIAPDAEALLEVARLEMANPLWRQRALDHLKGALALDPKLTAAWLELANYWSLRGEPDKQKRCLEAVLKYDARNEEVRGTLGLIRGSRP